MRLILLIPGIVVALLGIVLALSPLTTIRTQTATPPAPVEFNATSLVSVTGTYPLSFVWGAVSPATVVAATCESVNPQTSTMFSVCNGFVLITQQHGINGGFTAAPKLGAIVFVWVLPGNQTGPPPTVTVKIVGAEPALGTFVLLAGGAAVLTGAILPKKSRPQPISGARDPEGAEPFPWAVPPPSAPPPEWE
ncbi:MAG: hypothetical protein L3K14_06090 [Thermoplasmata archaeon]|nr:hypothetical protein [Thermoplasmata archaeon]